MTASHAPTTKMVDIMCHIIQWIIWNWLDLISVMRIIILKMFREKSIAIAVRTVLILVVGLMFEVESARIIKR